MTKSQVRHPIRRTNTMRKSISQVHLHLTGDPTRRPERAVPIAHTTSIYPASRSFPLTSDLCGTQLALLEQSKAANTSLPLNLMVKRCTSFLNQYASGMWLLL